MQDRTELDVAHTKYYYFVGNIMREIIEQYCYLSNVVANNGGAVLMC